MAVQTRYCGRCGAPQPFGATFCGRCGAPQPAAVAAAAPVYRSPGAPHVPYRTARHWGGSQIAVAGRLLAVLATRTVANTIFAAAYAASLSGTNSTSAQVRFAVIVASRGGVTVVFFAADSADPKHAPNGIPEGQSFDYVCSEFRWTGSA